MRARPRSPRGSGRGVVERDEEQAVGHDEAEREGRPARAPGPRRPPRVVGQTASACHGGPLLAVVGGRRASTGAWGSRAHAYLLSSAQVYIGRSGEDLSPVPVVSRPNGAASRSASLRAGRRRCLTYRHRTATTTRWGPSAPQEVVAMRIADVLARKGDTVVTIAPDRTVRELLALLAEHGIGAVVVSGDGSRRRRASSASATWSAGSTRTATRSWTARSRDHDRRGPHVHARRQRREPDGDHDGAPVPPRAGGRRRRLVGS